MNINSIDYDSYLAAIAQAQAVNTQSNNVQTNSTESRRDSYVSSIVSSDTAIPSGTYNSNGIELESFLPVTDTNTDSDISANQETAASGGVSGAGGGGSSDSEDETETEVVTIDGVTYLQTTTTDESGITTVTRTQIGTSPEDNEKSGNAELTESNAQSTNLS